MFVGRIAASAASSEISESPSGMASHPFGRSRVPLRPNRAAALWRSERTTYFGSLRAAAHDPLKGAPNTFERRIAICGDAAPNFLAVVTVRPQSRREDPPNLSILFRGGKETNQDSLSNGERKGKSPAPNPAGRKGTVGKCGVREGRFSRRMERSKSLLNGATARRGCQARANAPDVGKTSPQSRVA
jgi:hypothetical protein